MNGQDLSFKESDCAVETLQKLHTMWNCVKHPDKASSFYKTSFMHFWNENEGNAFIRFTIIICFMTRANRGFSYSVLR